MSAPALIAIMSLVQVLSLLGLSTFAALLPEFLSDWAITNTEAGWLSGLFFAGYMVAVPVLVSLTDRMDARSIFLAGSVLATLAGFGFAWLADGFWTAALFRILMGVGFAGTYMPGMKALTDRVGAEAAPRAVAYYTASFGVGGALSVYVAGLINVDFGWRWAFVFSAAGPALATVIVFAVLKPKPVTRISHERGLLNFAPVFANRLAMAYILAYTCHCWELFAMLSWAVAFLTAVAGSDLVAGAWWSPTNIGALVTLVALPASVLGNELCMRFGRRRMVVVLMLISAVTGCVLGFSAGLAYPVVAVLCLIYGATTASDSASVTAGAMVSADPDAQGATLAVHSMLGFGGAFLGPLVFGGVLDLGGGSASTVAWGLAFASAAVLSAIGAVVLPAMARSDPRHPEEAAP